MDAHDEYQYRLNLKEEERAKQFILFCDGCGEYNHDFPRMSNDIRTSGYFKHHDCGGILYVSETTTHDMLDNLTTAQMVALHEEIDHKTTFHRDAKRRADEITLTIAKKKADALAAGRQPYLPNYPREYAPLYYPDGHPRCPQCGALTVKPISTLKRLASVWAFGIASSTVGKSMECLSCKYKW